MPTQLNAKCCDFMKFRQEIRQRKPNERDKNLADLWVEFLLHETDAGGKKKKKKGVARVKLAG